MPRRGYRKGISDSNVPLTRQVYLRVTADVLVSLKQDAASRRLTVSKLGREILTAYATAQLVRLPQAKGPSSEALRELTRIGNNLNQIAREAHLMRLHLIEAECNACLEELMASARRLVG